MFGCERRNFSSARCSFVDTASTVVPLEPRVLQQARRAPVQRQAPLDGHALGREDRADARGRRRFPQGRGRPDAALPLTRRGVAPTFPLPRFPHPERAAETRDECGWTARIIHRDDPRFDTVFIDFFERPRFLRRPIIAVKCDRLFSLSGGYSHTWN